MAITAAQREALIELYVAIPGRAPDAAGLSFWAGKLETGTSLTTIAQSMWDSADAQALYPNSLTVEETVTAIYENVLGRTPDAAGLAFWVGRWNANGTNGEGKTLLEMIAAINNYSGSDPAALASQALFNDKVEFGEWFAIDLASNDLELAQLGFDVLNDGGSVEDAQAAVTTDPAENIILTAGQDIVTTGSGDDTFNGTQATLQNGDILDGGDGYDTLTLDVGGSSDFFAEVDTTSIEKIIVSSPNNNDQWIELDLSSSDGVTTLESYQVTSYSGEDSYVGFYDIQKVNDTDIRIIDTNVDHEFTYDTNAYLSTNGGNDDIVDLYLQEVGNYSNETGPVVAFGNDNPYSYGGSDVDRINITSDSRSQVNTTTSNFLYDLRVGSDLNDVFISGNADLEVEDYLDTNVNLVNAGALAADLTLDLYLQGLTWVSGVVTNTDGLTVVGAQGDDNIDAGAGEDGHGNFDLGTGNDNLVVGEYYGEDEYTDGHQTVNTGSGNDSVEMNTRGLLNIDLGTGNDDLSIYGDVDNLFTLAAYDGVSSVDAGDGDDEVFVGGYYSSYSTGAYDIDLGAGNDDLVMWVDGNPTVTAGAGNDTAVINVLSDVTFFGNDGDDELTINGDGVHSIDMGNGNDWVDINGDNTPGDDDLVDYGDDSVTTIMTGTGNDSVDVSHNHYLDVTLGTGDDQITLRAEDLTADDIIRGDEANDTQIGSDTMILTNTDGEWVIVGDSETSSTVGIETFDLRNQNIRLNLTEQNFDTATDDDITVSTRLANGVALPVLYSAEGVLAAEQFDQGMSREEYETIREKMDDGDYYGISAGTDVEDYLIDNGVNIIDFVDDDLSEDEDQVDSYGDDPVDSDDESEDSVFFQLEPDGEMIVDITDVPLTLLSERNFTLEGGNIKDVVIADDDSINGRSTLLFDDNTANNSIEDTLIVEGAASISAADLREVVGLENIILKSDANSAQTWAIELTDRVINQTTGSATLYIKVDSEVPAGSRLNITLDDSVDLSTNDVVIEANSNIEVYINGVLAVIGDDYNDGLNSITVQNALYFTTNADNLIGGEGDDNFYAQSVDQMQNADFADGLLGEGEDDDTLSVAFAPSNDEEELFEQFGDAQIINIEHLIFTSNDFTGLTGNDVRMDGIGIDNDFLNSLETFTTGTGEDSLDNMEGENDEGGVIQYYLNAGDDYFSGEDNDSYWVDAGAGNDGVYLGEDAENSTVYGGEGNDYIVTGEGDDYIEGGNGNDSIYAGSGNDDVFGDAGNDYIQGEDGADSLVGGSGNDTIYGEDDNDTIWGGTGNDYLYGDYGNDLIHAEEGNNYVEGGDGNDSISAGTGNDTIYGGTGNETISSGSGNDYIDADTGNTTIDAGAGNDSIVVDDTLDTADSINGGTGNDTLTSTVAESLLDVDFTNLSNLEVLNLSGFADTLVGETQFEETGITTINGGAGSDNLNFREVSNARDLVINTGTGADTVVGGSGDDSITVDDNSGVGFNFITGAAGADTIDLTASTAQADYLVFELASDGALTGANTGHDIIRGFESGVDRIIFDDDVVALSGIEDAVRNGAMTVVTNDSSLDITGAAAEVALYVNTALTNADLTQSGFTNILNFLNNNLDFADAGDEVIYAVEGTSNTALFFYQENGGDNIIDISEIRLLGVVEGTELAAGDFYF